MTRGMSVAIPPRRQLDQKLPTPCSSGRPSASRCGGRIVGRMLERAGTFAGGKAASALGWPVLKPMLDRIRAHAAPPSPALPRSSSTSATPTFPPTNTCSSTSARTRTALVGLRSWRRRRRPGAWLRCAAALHPPLPLRLAPVPSRGRRPRSPAAVPVKVIANFKRVKALTKELEVVADALRGSEGLVGGAGCLSQCPPGGSMSPNGATSSPATWPPLTLPPAPTCPMNLA